MKRNHYSNGIVPAATTVFLVAAVLQGADPPPAVAIRNARIYPGAGPVIERGTVVLRNGLVESVGASASVPADAWVVEGAGLWVYPGFIDGLSKWGIPPEPAPTTTPAPATRPSTATPAPPPPRGPEDRPSNTSWIHAQDLVRPAEAAIAAARNAGYATAVVYPTSGIFAGQGAAMNLAGDKSGEMVIASPTASYVSLTTRGFATFPGSIMGAIAYVRQVYLDADFYQNSKKAYAANPRGQRRPDQDRALEGVLEAPRVLLPADNLKEITRMTRFAAELKRPVILYGGSQAYRAAEVLRQSGLPVLINLKWPERDRDPDPEARDSFRTLETRELAPTGPASLVKAGVAYAFYSGGLEKPGDFRKAVRKALTAGLRDVDAVRAMSLSVAEIYGFADRAGSLEPGKIANLTVADGDIFEDKTRVKYVFIDGIKHEPLPEPESDSDDRREK